MINFRYVFSLVSIAVLSLTGVAAAATQQAVVSWTDLPNEDSYIIERKSGSTGTFAQVGVTAQNIVTYTDVNLPQGTNFCWRVTAKNGVGLGVPSDEACMTTAGTPGKVGGVSVIIQIVP
jgi:hypothetical protein